MTAACMQHLFSLPYTFFQRRSTGDLLQRVGSNSTVREIVTGGVLSGILDGGLVVTYFVILLFSSHALAVLVLVLGAVQYAVFTATRRQRRELMAEAFTVQAKSQSYSMEMISGVEILKASGSEPHAIAHWNQLFSAELDVSLRRGRLDTVVDTVTTALRFASSVLILGAGALEVMSGQLTLGSMLALVAIASGFLAPLSNLVGMADRLQLLSTYLERLSDVLLTSPEQDEQHRVAPGRLRGDIRLQDVSFRYSPYSPFVLQNISLHIQSGELVAIVGRSGSGKSTLARLMVGLYVPVQGTIWHDDHDLSLTDLRAVRQQVGMVTQSPQLFSVTIRENISLSKPALPLDKVIEAAKLAEIHADVMAMPMQYETLIADRGSSLSGGQQQRVAIARALAGQAPVLILDEATSQLDAITEAKIHRTLASLACTRIVIAHRLSTIVQADRIIVLDGGRIVEQGTHDALVAAGGTYSDLVRTQLHYHSAK